MAVVYSIFQRVGAGGGGKVRAVQHRLNALAEMPDMHPVLLSLEHHIRNLVNFAQLRASGALHDGVTFATLPQACLPAAIRAGTPLFTDYPRGGDSAPNKDSAPGKAATIREREEPGVGTVGTVIHAAGNDTIKLTLLNGLPFRQVVQRPDGSTVITDFAAGRPICRRREIDGVFRGGTNLVTQSFYGMPRAFEASLLELVDRTDAVVFFDGITSAYLAPFATHRSILFLHADHRNPDGSVIDRARALVEGFPGAAIVTATAAHRDRLMADAVPARPIEVLPHFIAEQPPQGGAAARANLVTVSRLSLRDKPVDQAIRAFASIMDQFPDVDYLIHGDGTDQPALAGLIDDLGCGGRVRLMGYTNAPAAVFSGALAAVSPTMGEGFGLSILEALSCGCPVISNDVDYGPREMIDGANGLLVSPGDIAALAQAMRRVLDDPAPFQAAARRGLDRYGREAYLRNYRRLVTRVLNDLPADAPAPDDPVPAAADPVAAASAPAEPGRLDHYSWHDPGKTYRLDA